MALPFRTWGGRRAGAGRPRGSRRGGHQPRPQHAARHPVHVNWRLVDGLPSLRGSGSYRAVLQSIARARDRLGARIVHFSVQGNHVHLLVEAADRVALSRALQGLAIRIARALNRALGRRGKVLAGRFHARTLETPLEVKRALRYVLSNFRHHAPAAKGPIPVGCLDGCSSALWFDGWLDPRTAESALLLPDPGWEALRERPVSEPRTWLLQTGWRRHGLIDPEETPGPSAERPAGSPKRSAPTR